jgi:hypothetical protein
MASARSRRVAESTSSWDSVLGGGTMRSKRYFAVPGSAFRIAWSRSTSTIWGRLLVTLRLACSPGERSAGSAGCTTFGLGGRPLWTTPMSGLPPARATS